MKFSRVFLLALLATIGTTQAADPLTVEQAWARATRPGQEVGAAYMNLRSATERTLVRIETPVAEAVEIHSMRMKEGVMQMRMLEKLALPAGQVVKLEPGGLHLMLVGLEKPLAHGESVTFRLHTTDAQGKSDVTETHVPIRLHNRH